MKGTVAGFSIVIFLLLGVVPLLGHHSFMAEFDLKKPIVLKGVVTKVEWMNPHAAFYIDVAGNNGLVKTWTIESACPNALMRRGWTRSTLQPGQEVVVEGFMAKKAGLFVASKAVTLPGGRRLMADADGVEP